MEEIKKYTITDADGNSIPEIKIISRDIIADVVNAYSDRRKYSKEQLIIEIKKVIENDLIQKDYNMIFEVNDNEGNCLADFILQGKMHSKISKISVVVNNAT
tara:strand:+ start:216 stop:521 length:306 start_codon:yes stop_codon:yes gene_type:complete